ncbi:C1-like protein, partial [Tanacetum coccineum]
MRPSPHSHNTFAPAKVSTICAATATATTFCVWLPTLDGSVLVMVHVHPSGHLLFRFSKREEIMEEINHFFHDKHPLKLIDWEMILGIIGVNCQDDEGKSGGGAVGCDICEEPLSNGDSAYACIQQRITRGFSYFVNEKDDKGVFMACTNCCLVEFARKAEADAVKEEAKIKFEHKGHPQHPLTLKLRPGAFHCDACNAKDEGLFYECDICDFWIHKSCATLAPTIHLPHHHPKHPLVLVYSLPDKFYRYSYYCKFCEKYIRRDDWLYHCANCRYFSHIKCALNAQQQPSTSRDDPRTSAASEDVSSLLHFPMSEAFTNPLKLLRSENIAQDDDETAEIYHWSHPDHPLILNVEDPQGNNMMPDANSGELMETHGKMRNSTFAMVVSAMATRSHTNAKLIARSIFVLIVHFYQQPLNTNLTTILLPNLLILTFSVRYCKGHEIPLTYPPVDDHPEDFYCDICEEEMDPNFPLYHCQKCKYRNSFHLDCISRNDYYANIWSEGTETVS